MCCSPASERQFAEAVSPYMVLPGETKTSNHSSEALAHAIACCTCHIQLRTCSGMSAEGR